ncbi:MAG: hypothetical protein D3906_05565 [Candidatus Electrothrix sp. AUS1_2]|nr:hypothetical protein [Candidatus Electrothrix sp. AUS1_2]
MRFFFLFIVKFMLRAVLRLSTSVLMTSGINLLPAQVTVSNGAYRLILAVVAEQDLDIFILHKMIFHLYFLNL